MASCPIARVTRVIEGIRDAMDARAIAAMVWSVWH
jgi:hypothetical protein